MQVQSRDGGGGGGGGVGVGGGGEGLCVQGAGSIKKVSNLELYH